MTHDKEYLSYSDQQELKHLYSMLNCYNRITSRLSRHRKQAVKNITDSYKDKIRKILKKEKEPRKTIKELGFSGFIELFELPGEYKSDQEAISWFEANEVIKKDTCDKCYTGWYKVFKRRNKYMAYHRLCFDH